MRIRTVKPEFWSHPIMARLPPTTQLLALALLNHADDHGYFHAEPAIVRGACAPFREDLASLSEDLAKLSEVGWIEVVTHPDQGRIGLIVNWTKHQRVDHPSASKIMGYFTRENVAKPREKLALDQGSGIRDQGTGSEGGEPAAPSPFLEIAKRHGLKTTKGGEDLIPEWRSVTKGLRVSTVERILVEARPGIQWPYDFKRHREQRGI